MKTHRVLHSIWLAVLGLSLAVSLPVHASDAPMVDDARKVLEKAWNPAGDAPSVTDRIQLLKTAMADLKDAPSGSGLYWRHLTAARKFIKAALYELDKGDPDQKATDLIHSAVSEIRDIT